MIPGEKRFGAVIVGGGVYGILLALEGAARGQKVLLVERDDVGSGASFNHLRTIHGGLRYLQSLDVRRAVRSARQRLWWLSRFPDLVQPTSCLMPLYNRGLRRPDVFHFALLLAKLLGLHRNEHGGSARLEVISREEVRRLLPLGRTDGLVGGAIWTDAFMMRSHRVTAELVHWAESAGATVLNHTEFMSAKRHHDREWRVSLQNSRTGATEEVTTTWIVNAAAAASDDVIDRVTGKSTAPVLVPTQAWNVLIDRPPVSDYAVAATALGHNEKTYFLHPYHGRTLVGTGHASIAHGAPIPTEVTAAQLRAMIDALNAALPGARFSCEQVRHVFHGVIPGVTAGSDTVMMRHDIIDHGKRDGARDFWTVLGVKFTEAPFVARRFWNERLGRRSGPFPERPVPVHVPTVEDARGMSDEELRSMLSRIAALEWHASADDLAWRRTDLWMDEEQARRVARLAVPVVPL